MCFRNVDDSYAGKTSLLSITAGCGLCMTQSFSANAMVLPVLSVGVFGLYNWHGREHLPLVVATCLPNCNGLFRRLTSSTSISLSDLSLR